MPLASPCRQHNVRAIVPEPLFVGAEDVVDGAQLVLRVDIAIAAIIFFVVLLRLPRAIARLSQSHAWTHGYILRSVKLASPTTKVTRPGPTPLPSRKASTKSTGASSDSHYWSQSTSTAHMTSGLPFIHKPNGNAICYPPHRGAWPAFARPLAPFARWRVYPGVSLGQMLVLLVYFAILAYASFWKSSPFNDPLRTGFVAMSQIPVVFALAQRSSVIGFLLGVGYEKLNYIHRFAGRLLVVSSNIHALGYFYRWANNRTVLQNVSAPHMRWGVVALVALDIMCFFSTAYWRKRAYKVFATSHFLGFVILLPACVFHKSVMTPYVLGATAFYTLDRLIRLLKLRLTDARIRPIPQLNLTRLEIPHLNSGWRAGQHVRLRVLSTEMGIWGWTEAHPFTVASVSDSHDGLVLMIKNSGDWTGRLYDVAKAAGYGEKGVMEKNVKVVVEGPYGGPGHLVFDSFSAAMFVVGGSGLSFALSAVQELIQSDMRRGSRVKVIEVVWVVRDPASLKPMLPLFNSLIQESVLAPLRISVFYTRASATPPPPMVFQPGLTLTPGRPKLGKILDGVVGKVVSLGAGAKDEQKITGALVGVCGPREMADDVVQVVAALGKYRRDAAGGVEVHEEIFA